MNNELLVLSSALPVNPQDQAEYELLIEALSETVSEQKQLEASLEIKELSAALKSKRATLKPWAELEEDLRARVIAAKNSYERAVSKAIEAGEPCPTGFADPKCISWRKLKRWRLEGQLHEVDERFKKEVIDEEAVKAAIEAGEVPPGIELYDDWSLTLRAYSPSE